MAVTISDTAANDAVNAVAVLLNSGTIEIRTGTKPSTVATTATGTILGTLTFASTAFGSASSRTATAGTITGDTSADNTGTAGWFRAYNSSSVAVLDGTVGTSGADINLSSVSIVAGGSINVTSLTLAI